MSAETKAAFEAALQAHVADEADANEFMANYVLGCATTSFGDNEPDTHSYWFESSDNQPAHISRGLADLVTEWAASTMIFRDDDD